MLAHLSIRNIVLIDRLDLAFEPGLSVLTGETGAGKSILLDALSLALGARGDAGRVREGEKQGQVVAAFDVPLDHPARKLLTENGFETDGDLVLKRVQQADGRARVFINDQPASVTLMRDVGAMLVEIHGQHDDRALVDPASHRALLDAFGGLEGLTQKVADLNKSLNACLRDREAQAAELEAAEREQDYLRSSLAELKKLDPKPGEEEALALKRIEMMNAEKTVADIHEAQDILSGSTAPVPVLAALHRRLARKAADAPALIDPILAALDQALNQLDHLQVAVDDAVRASQYDPAALEAAEERLFALRGLARKHNCLPDLLPDLMAKVENSLDALDAGNERLAELDARAAELRTSYDAAAADLSAKRREAAEALCAAVHAELPGLKLGEATFLVEQQTDPERRTSDGIDTIEFWVRTNPGTKAGPMMRVASGGELSRFLLALKVALAERGSAPTLVFDEIDTGVGGAVADAIGQRLARLADRVQVLSVTHAPQVAARARTHLLISKGDDGAGGTRTKLDALARDGRQEEIARMLAGATITDEARRAAERLLDPAL